MNDASLEAWERHQVNGGPIKEIFEKDESIEEIKWI